MRIVISIVYATDWSCRKKNTVMAHECLLCWLAAAMRASVRRREYDEQPLLIPPSMLQTPDAFVPLIDPPEPAPAATETLTFVFHRGRLLLRTPGLSLPTAAEAAALDIDLSRAQPVGLWQGRYCQTVWTDEELLPSDSSLAWHGMRSLFQAVDDGFLGLASRAVQLAEWAHAPPLRRVRHAHAAHARRTLFYLRRLRHAGVSAHLASDDGVDPQGRFRAAGHAQAFAVAAFQPAGRFPGSGRIDRGSRAP